MDDICKFTMHGLELLNVTLKVASIGSSPSWEKRGPGMCMHLIKPTTHVAIIIFTKSTENRCFSLRGCGMIQELPRHTSVLSEYSKLGTIYVIDGQKVYR